jgi:FKBP-type peptidyl-prolyl cis-trans isomerase FkpA
MSRALVLSLTLLCCTRAPAVDIEHTTFAAALNVDLAQSTKLPSGMYVRDLTVGTGAMPTTGQLVTARYTGWLVDGTQFDSNQSTGFQFHLGRGEVITGWDVGVAGMKVGGTRQLIIPPELGYGSSGQGPIPPDAVLVFTVSMI